jgi:DNA polymerase (family X)
MTNADIAAAFALIGKILDLKGENVFRVRAYERAAQTILSLTEDLAEIHARGGKDALKDIPGIGEDLASKIEELVTTKKLKYMAELQKEVPPGVIALMEIPGLGPKKAKLVWQKFDVVDIPSLKTLLSSGKLEKEKGWGPKSVAKIVEGLADKESLGSRMPLHTALQLGESLKKMLAATKLCQRIELAGSLRRRKETIGDIDILVTAENAEKVMDAFCGFPNVRKVIGRGPTKVSVLLDNGIQSDLRVLTEDVFGAALHYFTGSKQHNVKLRGMANKIGVTISEYGVFKGTAEEKGKLIAGRTEEDVFRVVGLPYIPPELREDRGEIEAALGNALPPLIETSDIKGDLHMHSTFSDGEASMEDMARAAKERGLQYIAITDHASPMGMVRGIKPDNIDEYVKLVEKARKAVKGIHILAGAEVDILPDGSLYLPDKVLKKLDWVVVSIHGQFKQTREEMTARILRALENPHVNLFAHPTARLLLKRPGIDFDVGAVFSAAVKHGVALELNASVDRLDLDDVHCKRAKELGAKICIDGDAHHARDLDYEAGVAQARRGWLTKQDVVNAWGWGEFQAFLEP